MVDDILRMRATISTEESLAAMRAWGREIGMLPQKVKPGVNELNKTFGTLSKTIQGLSKDITTVVPALGAFGLGAGGAAAAAGVLLRTFSDVADKVVELKFASKELGMSERDIRAWGLAAQKVGLSSQSMMQGLKGFHEAMGALQYNQGSAFALYEKGAGPLATKLKSLKDPAEQLREVFKFKDTLLTQPNGQHRAEQFMVDMGLGADKARISYEQFNDALGKTKAITPEAQERAQKFRDSLKELGEEWDTLVIKTSTPLFPALTASLKSLNEYLDTLGKIKDGAEIGWGPKLQPYLGKGTIKPSEWPWFPQKDLTEGPPVKPGTLNDRWGGLGGSPLKFADMPAGTGKYDDFINALPFPEAAGQIEDRRGEAGGDASGRQRIIKAGVFEALVEFQSYVMAGGGTGQAQFFGGGAGGGMGGGGGGGLGAGSGGGGGMAGGGGGGYGGGGAGGGGGYGGRGRTGTGTGTGTGTEPEAPPETPDAVQAPGSVPLAGSGVGTGFLGSSQSLSEVPGLSSGSGGGGGNNLAAMRAEFKKELDADPTLKSTVIGAMQHEGGIQSNAEQLMNMAAMRHQTIRQALYSGQYGPVTGHNRIPNIGEISAKTREQGEAALAKVYGGSNITDYSTDQGMAGDPNYDKYMANPKYWGMHKVEGAWFSYHGEEGRKWAAQQRAAAAGRRPTLATAADANRVATGDRVMGGGRDLRGTDPRISEIVKAAAEALPPGYKIQSTSGVRTEGQGQHTLGNAQDWQIVGPDGAIVNRGKDVTGLYTTLARHAYGYQEKYHPELTGKFQWGGQFGTSSKNPWEPDLMHFDVGGRRGRIAEYSRERIGAALPPIATRRSDEAVATRGINANGQVSIQIHSDGTAARTRTKTNGDLFQKTEIQSYKQMQPTSAPAPRVNADASTLPAQVGN